MSGFDAQIQLLGSRAKEAAATLLVRPLQKDHWRFLKLQILF